MRDMPSNSDAVVGRDRKGVPGVSAGNGSGCKRPGRHPAFVGLLHTVFYHLISSLLPLRQIQQPLIAAMQKVDAKTLKHMMYYIT